jgi:HSP20 family protein
MSRWDPFREMLSLREAMNQLLEESVVRPASAGAASGTGGSGGGGVAGRGQPLALDVAEREDAYVVSASLPGVRPEDVHVTVLGDTLAIRAETRREDERSSGGYLLRERQVGTLQRTVTLPGPISADDVSADFEHGILTLTLPKSRANLPRRIQVRSGATGGAGGAGGTGGQAGIDAGTGSPGGEQTPIEAAVRPTESGVSASAEATTGVDAESQQESTPTTTTRPRGGRRTSRTAGSGGGTGQPSDSAGEAGASGSSRSRGGQRNRRQSSGSTQEG